MCQPSHRRIAPPVFNVQKRGAREFGPGLLFELAGCLGLAQDMRVAEAVGNLVHPAIRQEVVVHDASPRGRHRPCCARRLRQE